jgi:hypothetical protein
MQNHLSLRLILILFFCMGSKWLSYAQAPNFQWAKAMGAFSDDGAYSVVVDPSGNVYTTGYFNGTVDFDPGPGTFNLSSAGGWDIFISKLDAAGNFIWAKSIGGSWSDVGASIVFDSSGNVYVTGLFYETVDFDPGPGTFYVTSSGTADIFILKLDTFGSFVWAKTIGGTLYDSGCSITLDSWGNIYNSGYFKGSVDFDPGPATFNLTAAGEYDTFILKLDPSGNFLWAKTMGGNSDDHGYYLALDAAGNVYTTGEFGGTADFDPGPGVYNLTSAGSYDIFISKLDAAGNFLWAKSLGGNGADLGYSIALDASGNVYATGYFSGSADFDPGPAAYNLVSEGSQDIFISKLDSSGNFLWTKAIGGIGDDWGWSLALDASSNVYATGFFTSSVDFDPGPGVYNLTSAGAKDIFILKLDAAGNFLWAKSMGGTGMDSGFSICLDPQGQIYTAGYFSATTDFDPGPNTFNLASAGNGDIFVHKMCQSAPAMPSGINGPVTVCSGATNQYSLAPTAGAMSYSWSLPAAWLGSSLTNSIMATAGSSGIFTVAALNACGASPSQTLDVIVNISPTLSAAASTTLLCIGQSATLTAGGADTFTWNPGGLGANLAVWPSVTTTYTLSGSMVNGCEGQTQTLSIVVNEAAPISASTSNTLLCKGQSATLTANGASTYTWNPGGTGTSITVSPSLTTTYTVTGTDENGCTNSAIVTQSVEICNGINQMAGLHSQWHIYPNPFTNKVTIVSNLPAGSSTPKADLSKTLQVYNANGSLVFIALIENQKTEIDLSNQAAGIYFIKIGDITGKIVKE